MKNIFKILLATISILLLTVSIFGIILFVAFYLYKNKEGIKEILNNLNKKIQEKSRVIDDLKLNKKISDLKEKVEEFVENSDKSSKLEVDQFSNFNGENIIEDKFENNLSNNRIELNKKELKNNEGKLKPKLRKEKNKKVKVQSINLDVENASDLNPRQSKLLSFIKENKSATMKNINFRFRSVTQRTLRRDLSKLESEGYLIQQGATRNSIYLLKEI